MLGPTDAPLAVALLTLGVLALPAGVRTAARQLVVDYGVVVLFALIGAAGIWLFLNRDAVFLRELLRQYWLLALFAIFVLEGAMLLYFAPSESLVPVAIGLAAGTDVAGGTTTVYTLIVVISVIGATTGQYLLFLLAKRWGRERLLEQRWFRVSPGTLDRFDRWFARWGLLAVPVSNTLLFTRGMLTVPAGLAEMDDRQFVALSAVGTLVFETTLALLTLGIVSAVPLV